LSWRYALRRLLQIFPTLGAILLLSFVLIHLAPGDPVRALAGEGGDPAYYARMREKFGLDRPLSVQLGTYVWNVLRGDLGVSFVYGRPAVSVILGFIPATLLLTGAAFLLSSVLGVGFGLLAARRPGGRLDSATNLGSLVAHATPNFVLGQIVLLTLAFSAGLFPTHGMTDARNAGEGLGRVVDVAHHLVLPALVVAMHDLALIVRLTRTNLIGELGKDHIRTALAKGLSGRRVVAVHALPGALIPVITALGTRVGGLFAGAAVVEIVFGWPGIGRLLLTATQGHDYPVLLGIFLVVGFALVFANLMVDLLYARLDPTVRYE
jgi:peptide/nickel transport system permease protein